MTAEEWQDLKGWFSEAMGTSPPARDAIVERARHASPELARELEALLAAHDHPRLGTRDLIPPAVAREEIYPSGEQLDAMAGPYRLLHELGRGGSGVVFLAERADDEFHRPVALKLLRYRCAGSERQASLTSERRALARLQHSHIASLFDWGTTSDGSAWLVTEWVDGQPIDVYCREHHLPAAAVVGLLLQVGQAVAYAHDRGIVHRDLKPGNIVVTRNGVAKLLDFGIAREADEAAPPTPQFTPRYASPEQLRGEPAAPPSDIYSLAAVAGELLTGAVPPRLGDVDRELTGVLRRAMDLHPARRYATVPALLEDLRRWQRGLPPLGVAVPWRRRAGLLWRRKRLAVGATAVAVVAIAAGLGLAALRPRTAAAPAPLVHPLAASVTFAPQPVHRAAAPVPVRVVLPRGGQVATVRVVTQGFPNLDFSSADSANCSGTFAPGQACTLHVTFAPTAVGSRQGAVVLSDRHAIPLTTVFLNGVGQGALAAFQPARQFRFPLAHSAGDVVVFPDGALLFSSSTGPVTLLRPSPSGGELHRFPGLHFISIAHVAIDGAGNLYLTDSANGVPGQGAIYKVPTSAGIPAMSRAQAIHGLNAPQPVITGTRGNVFFAGGGAGTVTVLPAGADFLKRSLISVARGVAVGNPQGLVLDRNRTLWLSGANSPDLNEVLAPLRSPALSSLSLAPRRPWALGTDPAGDLYFSDGNQEFGGTGRMYRVPFIAGRLAFAHAEPLAGPAPRNPRSIAMDNAGNLWVGSRTQRGEMDRYALSRSPRQIACGAAPVGGPALRRLAFTLSNLGNVPLRVTAIQVDGAAFAASGCSPAAPLLPGATCREEVWFAPRRKGIRRGTLLLGLLAANEPAQISVALTGTGR